MTERYRPKTKVMVFGVFDFLHPGHISFLKQAKRLGDYLVVSVARDANVLYFKGRLPVFSEKEREKALMDLDFVDEVILGGLDNPWSHIKEAKPYTIALGYDQKPYLAVDIRGLTQELKTRGLNTKIVRLKGYKSKNFKASNFRFLEGVVKKSKGRGRRLGFPTANMSYKFDLPEGVYAAFTFVNSRALPALVFLGSPKTFETRKMNVETYILDFRANIYGKKIKLELLRKLRDNKKFASAKALVIQMKKDEKLARRFFKTFKHS